MKDAQKNKSPSIDIEKMLATQLSLDDLALFMTRFRLIKILHQRIKQKSKKIEGDTNNKTWLNNNDYSGYINDKTSKWNPSNIWNEVITKLPSCEKLNALIGQSKIVQNLTESFDLSICLIFGFDVSAMKAKKYGARRRRPMLIRRTPTLTMTPMTAMKRMPSIANLMRSAHKLKAIKKQRPTMRIY